MPFFVLRLGPWRDLDSRLPQGRSRKPPVNPDSHYQLGPDSLPREGVAKGEVRGPFTLPSQAYPGTQHTYWVYVPAQYNPSVPASLMIFNDGRRSRTWKGISARRTCSTT